MRIPTSEHLSEVKYRILKAVIMTASVALFIVSLINILNQRPFLNFILPFIASLIFAGLLKLTDRPRWRYPIKLFVMIFLSNIYLPIAWLTSPGSYSAMSFYAVLILFISILFSEKPIEFLSPVVALIQMIALLNFEPLHPDLYSLYTEPIMRGFDLSINFTVVFIILFIITITINAYFEDEHQKLFETAITDQLTGVYNRRYLFARLEEIHAESLRSDRPYTLLMIDINHFKLINDTYGHATGDLILIELGRILKLSCRRNDLATRFGGDEFIIILPHTSLPEGNLVAERIKASFEPLCDKYQREQLSLGIGITQSSGQSIDEIIQQVDDHLYHNKRVMKGLI